VTMIHSVVMIIAAELQEKASLLECAIGKDEAPLPGKTYVRPLSPDGSEPVTHWGCHTWETQAFLDGKEAAKSGDYPPSVDFAVYGLSKDDAHSAAAGLIVSVRDIAVRPRDHWDEVLAASGLVPVVIKTEDLKL